MENTILKEQRKLIILSLFAYGLGYFMTFVGYKLSSDSVNLINIFFYILALFLNVSAFLALYNNLKKFYKKYLIYFLLLFGIISVFIESYLFF